MTPADQEKFRIASALLGESERFRLLDRLEAYYLDMQEDWKKEDWLGRPAPSGGWRDPQYVTETWAPQGYAIVDRRQRRATVRYPMARQIVNTYTNLLFSEGRFPEIRYEGNPQAQEKLRNAVSDAAIEATMIRARSMGGSMGTAVVTYGFVDGRLTFECHNPKHVEVLEWANKAELRPKKIRIQYVYPATDGDGNPEEKSVYNENAKEMRMERVWRWYRREIGADADVLFTNPELIVDQVPVFEEAQRVENKLGKFRGVWIQNIPCDFTPDGMGDYEHLLDNLDNLNASASQLDRVEQYSGDPALAMFLEEGHEVGEVKRSPENALILRKGEDMKYVEVSGASIQSLRDHVKELRTLCLEGAQIVPLDPKELSGRVMSAKAMEYLWQPTLAEAGKYRTQYGKLGLKVLLELIVEDMRLLESTGEAVMHKGDVGKEKVLASVSLNWPPYFAPTLQDVNDAVTASTTAELGGYISRKTAMSFVAPYFGVKDLAAEQKEIEANPRSDEVSADRVAAAEARRAGTRTEEGSQGGNPGGAEPRFRGRQ